jgi:phosphoribosylglycinamide formyltransferase 2
LPIPVIHQNGPSASCAVLVEGEGRGPRYHGIADALAEPDTQLRIFGKPEVKGRRRMAVTLARDTTIDAAKAKAIRAAKAIRTEL